MTPAQAALLQPQPMPVSVLTPQDYAAAAATLQCEVAAILAVAHVETGQYGPFEAQGRPTILFEHSYFSKQSHGMYDASHPDISNTTPRNYGPSAAQYPKILEAAELNFDLALCSASWGKFQIMGWNFKPAGFASVEPMVAAMRSGVAAHLKAFVSFVASSHATLQAIQTKDWAGFAFHYNGKDYAAGHYDTKLAAAYAANINPPRAAAGTFGARNA